MKTNTEVVEETLREVDQLHAETDHDLLLTEIMEHERKCWIKALQAKDTQAEEMIKEILNGEPYIYHADIETIAQKYGIDLNSDKK